ncbi:MAG: HAD-IIB family hydrolase [Bryobacteraceae bacterium]
MVYTDLDGTLLDHDTYGWEAARPALELLDRTGTPLVFVTSKTWAETDFWRCRIANRHPAVVENGGAIYIPNDYFQFPLAGARQRGAYQVLEFGDSYASLVAALREAGRVSGVRVRGFSDMTIEEVSELCALTPEQAALAKTREFDEAFEILDAERQAPLLAAIENLGKQWTRGGRFYHILGENDKALAVRTVSNLYRRSASRVLTIGLGDGMNDAGFLNAVDIPILMPSPALPSLRAAVPHGRLGREAGPAGWNAAILSLIR